MFLILGFSTGDEQIHATIILLWILYPKVPATTIESSVLREEWFSNPNTTVPLALNLSAVIKSYLSLSLQENKSSFSKGRLWRNDMIWVLLQNSYLLTFIGHPLSARSHSKHFTYINSFSLCNNLMMKVQFPRLIFIWKSSQTKPQTRYRDVKCFAWSRVPRGGARSPKPEPAV